MTMTRRALLAGTPMMLTALGAGRGMDMSRISVITDECSATPADAIAFAGKYNLRWVELRDVPGTKKTYSAMTPEELRRAAVDLKRVGLRVAFFNARGTKYPLPGTTPRDARNATPERLALSQRQFDNRIADLRRDIAAAQAFDTKYVRVFAFGRVADVPALLPRLAEVLGEMGEVARKEGMMLLLENEPACNVGTCAEFAALIKLLPESSFGINWDANNGQSMKEKPFPDGYALLPKKRIVHVHMHGRTLLDPEKMLDWSAIFKQLTVDGYKGCAGLETHYFDGTKIAKSHLCMEVLQKMFETKS